MACERLVVDVRPKPSCDQRMTTVPRPIRARLRTAWNATWGSFEHACTHRSPPERSGSSSSPGSGGSGCRGAGRPEARPNRWSNSDGPRPMVTVSCEGPRPIASPVSVGGSRALGAGGSAGRPAVMRAAAAVHSRSSSCTDWRSSTTTSKAAKCRRSCAGVAIPAWWRPVNGTALPATASSSDGRRPDLVPSNPCRGDARSCAGAEQGSPRQRHQLATIVPPTWERGSASASTAWLSLRRCAGVTVE